MPQRKIGVIDIRVEVAADNGVVPFPVFIVLSS
jgi:hypothetical protein